jgi:hypothetical protein
LITDTATGDNEWRSHPYVAARVAQDPLRFSAVIGRERAPLLRDPFSEQDHIQIADCWYPDAA